MQPEERSRSDPRETCEPYRSFTSATAVHRATDRRELIARDQVAGLFLIGWQGARTSRGVSAGHRPCRPHLSRRFQERDAAWKSFPVDLRPLRLSLSTGPVESLIEALGGPLSAAVLHFVRACGVSAC